MDSRGLQSKKSLKGAAAFALRPLTWFWNTSPVWHLVLPTVAMLCIGIVLIAIYLPGAMQSAALDAAYRSNIEVADQIKITRGYYTRKVVAKAIETGALRPDHNHEGDPMAIPLPATFVKDISDLLQAKDTTLSLVSPYPWPHRADRKMDDFQSQAWDSFQRDPAGAFARQEIRDGRRMLRVAVADRMTEPACVACHNADPQSVKRDWKLNDVRAVMEVTKVVEPYLASAESRSSMIVWSLVAAGSTVSIVLVIFTGLVSRQTRAKQEADARLRDALDVMPQGLALFDAQDRYALWNRRYAELYPESADLLVEGATFEDVLRAGIARGQYPEAQGREEEWLAQRLAHHKLSHDTHEQQLLNGRWLRVEERRTADGGSIGIRTDITELKQREVSFRFLFESNPVPLWIVDQESLKFMAVNDACVALYCYSREQFLTMTVLDIRPVKHRAAFEDLWRSGQRSQGSAARRHLRSDGTTIQVAVYSRAMEYEGRAASLAAVVDVTDRKRAEDELRGAQEFLSKIIESVPSTIAVKNIEDNRYVLINRAGEQLFGIPQEEMIGKTTHDFFPKEQADRALAHDKEALDLAAPPDFREYVLDTRGGPRIIRSKRAVINGEGGKPQYILRVAEDVTERKKAEDRIAHMAHHDHLTDLPNRTSFNEQFDGALKHAAASGQPFAILSIDLDRFKEVNDVFGHFTGDALLREAARRLQIAAHGAFVARLGGDEFTIIAEGGEQPQAAGALADRLMKAAAQPFDIEGRQLRIGLSIGIAIHPTDGGNANTLLSNADAALYRAKADGRSTVRFFQPEMDRRLRERRSLQRDLELAIERSELSLDFQPQATIGGEITGFEALLRWNHPTQGPILPSAFVSVAEESGLILTAGEWVLRTACREAASWPNPLQIAVNLSPVQFQHGDLPALVCAILLETGLSPRRLELEITEGVLIGDPNRALSILRRLKALGVRVSMDDFGTGYSSLSYLQSFPFDKIKIDQSFISNVHRNPQSMAIVRAVIALCRSLDLTVVAEGVETAEQLAFLVREQCDEVQGYLIGRPLPIDRYVELVRPASVQKAFAAG